MLASGWTPDSDPSFRGIGFMLAHSGEEAYFPFGSVIVGLAEVEVGGCGGWLCGVGTWRIEKLGVLSSEVVWLWLWRGKEGRLRQLALSWWFVEVLSDKQERRSH